MEIKKLKTIIVEDEIHSREYLIKIIHDYCPNLELVGLSDNVNHAVKLIKEMNPDLLLLDIEIKQGSSFDILDQLENKNFKVIFTTAYERYALKAFKYAAMNYLLKPIDIEELIEAVKRVQPEVQYSDHLAERIEILKNSLDQTFNRIAIHFSEGFQMVRVEDILYCLAENNYTHIYMENNKQTLSSKTLKYYEELLNPQLFFRISRSCIVNLSKIETYIRSKKPHIILLNGMKLDVAQAKSAALIGRLNESN